MLSLMISAMGRKQALRSKRRKVGSTVAFYYTPKKLEVGNASLFKHFQSLSGRHIALTMSDIVFGRANSVFPGDFILPKMAFQEISNLSHDRVVGAACFSIVSILGRRVHLEVDAARLSLRGRRGCPAFLPDTIGCQVSDSSP